VEYASYRDVGRLLVGDDLVRALDGVDVLVTEVDVVDAASVREARDLRVVVACRGDAVNVDVAACTALGIPVLFTPGRNAEAVADLTLAFFLALGRKLPAAMGFLREPGGRAGDMGRMGRAFATLRGDELGERTVGLIGLGAVGRAVARRLRAFGTRVLVHDPPPPAAAVVRAGARPVGLDELLAESDFVSLHAAVTDETQGMIGARELALMKPGAGLINVGRAAVVDYDALRDRLAAGQLSGAILDVFDPEPLPPDSPLWQTEKLLVTPHISADDGDSYVPLTLDLFFANMRRYLAGEPLQNVVRPELGY